MPANTRTAATPGPNHTFRASYGNRLYCSICGEHKHGHGLVTHTPGPWTIDRPQGRISGETYPEVVGFRTSAALYAEFTELVEANARLIAAAPEMAEQLRECHKMLIDMYDRDELTEDDATLEMNIRRLLARIDGTEGGAQ